MCAIDLSTHILPYPVIITSSSTPPTLPSQPRRNNRRWRHLLSPFIECNSALDIEHSNPSSKVDARNGTCRLRQKTTRPLPIQQPPIQPAARKQRLETPHIRPTTCAHLLTHRQLYLPPPAFLDPRKNKSRLHPQHRKPSTTVVKPQTSSDRES